MEFIVFADEPTSWWDTVFSARTLGIALWIGLAALTITLLVLTRTRWGQAQPLSKCVALSVFAHFLFLMYAYGTRLIFEQPIADKEVIQLTIVDAGEQKQRNIDDIENTKDPWDNMVSPAVVKPNTESPERLVSLNHTGLPNRQNGLPEFSATPASDRLSPAERIRPIVKPQNSDSKLWTNNASQSDVKIAPTRPDNKPAENKFVGPSITGPARVRPTQTPPNIERKPSPNNANTQFQNDDSRMQRLVQTPISTAKNDSIAGQIDQIRQSNNKFDSRNQVTSPSPSAKIDANTIAKSDSSAMPSSDSGTPKRGDGSALPKIYKNRASDNFERIAAKNGGDARTEAAVQAALRWLAAHQEQDGRWDSSRFGGGRISMAAGQNRQGAGIEADTGITGLAILAFLAHGQTHLKGEYRKNVQHGLEFLLRAQKTNGSLAGESRLFAAMYCHGMAMLAISEAFAITGDDRIKPFVERAVKFSVESQDKTSGGWRYRPGDQGDMSQFGWQVMALKSAEMGGIKVPVSTREGMLRFMKSVSSGTYGGLASYKSRDRISRTMTAEALTCRYFLSTANDRRLVDEATAYIVQEVPQAGTPNLYYWYYGTMAMYQSGNARWKLWNEAMKRQLVVLQQTQGDNAGSWNPDTVWGGCGGRVYSTAMAALCLEIYYRYLPTLSDGKVD